MLRWSGLAPSGRTDWVSVALVEHVGIVFLPLLLAEERPESERGTHEEALFSSALPVTACLAVAARPAACLDSGNNQSRNGCNPRNDIGYVPNVNYRIRQAELWS